MGATGGTNHLLSQTLVDEIDIDLPQITMNLPAFNRQGFGDQGRKYSNPKNILYHNNEDLVWDCETLWEELNAVPNRQMSDCKIRGACKTN